MLAFAGMLVDAAKAANIGVPPNPDHYDPGEYPYWHVFCNVQLGASMPQPNAHWINAEIISQIPHDDIKTITGDQLMNLGVLVGYPVL